ncbi:MAG: hypothetical protein E5X72_29300 [Mesorhizobium sp.]|uniref:hypothetical protein n=1 Tax=Mesorhizobium sp. TaxID=1871066 RepID=UPI001213EBCD|nr:hypothetical protein [Mesorhizobium sp.]TIP00593.1 MAG: hypothetical protein E5X72_29300 [Mesorhizobium sp.]
MDDDALILRAALRGWFGEGREKTAGPQDQERGRPTRQSRAKKQGSERVSGAGRLGSSTAKAATDRNKVGAAFCITRGNHAGAWPKKSSPE